MFPLSQLKEMQPVLNSATRVLIISVNQLSSSLLLQSNYINIKSKTCKLLNSPFNSTTVLVEGGSWLLFLSFLQPWSSKFQQQLTWDEWRLDMEKRRHSLVYLKVSAWSITNTMKTPQIGLQFPNINRSCEGNIYWEWCVLQVFIPVKNVTEIALTLIDILHTNAFSLNR